MELSARSAQVFAADTRPVSRIEWIYHLLVADPERGAAELEDLDRLFSGSARHEDIAALSAALTELDTTHILQGKALVRARLVVAEYRADVAGASSVSDLATQLLQMAETIEDDLLIGDAYSLVGEAAQARGDLAAAEQSYTQTLAIFKRLAALDPTNTSWQRSLAVAHSRVGDLAQARGDLAAAEQSYTQTLAISERLAALDPTNTSWQRDLTTAHERVAGVARKGTRRRWRRILKWFGR
jgi:tetratricopeptide (TPR) repeat protein